MMKKITAALGIFWRLVAIIPLCLLGFTLDVTGDILSKMADRIGRLVDRIIRNAPRAPWL